MPTRQTARQYTIHVGCLLASIAVDVAVNRGLLLVSHLVPVLAFNVDFSGHLLIVLATELTAEFGWFFVAMFLPSGIKRHFLPRNIKRHLSFKRHLLVDTDKEKQTGCHILLENLEEKAAKTAQIFSG